MKKYRSLVLGIGVLLILATGLSVGVIRTKSVPVVEGFVFGPPVAQSAVSIEGTYQVKYYGYPSTYRERHTFLSEKDTIGYATYDFQPFEWYFIVSNILFWMALFVAVLAPITIFWRPKKAESTTDVSSNNTDVVKSKVANNANTGN